RRAERAQARARRGRGRLGPRPAGPGQGRVAHARRPRGRGAPRPPAPPRREPAQPRHLGRPDRRVAVPVAARHRATAGGAMSAFRVRVEKDYTVFSAGHFITYEGHLCEALHGHNYRVAAGFEGPLDENFYVLDFGRIKRLLKTVIDRLDHRMLLPTRNERVRVQQTGNEITAMYEDKRHVFPASDVVPLAASPRAHRAPVLPVRDRARVSRRPAAFSQHGTHGADGADAGRAIGLPKADRATDGPTGDRAIRPAAHRPRHPALRSGRRE